MRTLFLDTSYVIALEAADDQHHETTSVHWQHLANSIPSLVTTSYIFDEILTFFNSRNRHAKAIEIGNRLLSSPSVQFIHIDPPLFQEAWRYFMQHPDKSYSFTDCVSFIVMKRLGIKTALTLDKHFLQAEFDKEPKET